MEGFSLVDIYSTKGIEYLIAAVFFFGFLALQRYILTSAPGGGKDPGNGCRPSGLVPRPRGVRLPPGAYLDEGGPYETQPPENGEGRGGRLRAEAHRKGGCRR